MNTGVKIFTELIEVFVDTGQPTGNIKPNVEGDPDYIAPTIDLVSCPVIPTTTTTTTTSTTTAQPIKCIAPALVSVQYVSGQIYRVNFETEGNNLSAITAQISLNGINWTNITGTTSSPRYITLPSSGLWYVRLVATCGSLVSVPSNTVTVFVSGRGTLSPVYFDIRYQQITQQENVFDIDIQGLVLQEGDIASFQLTSLSSKGASVIVDGVSQILPGYGFLEVNVTLSAIDISNGSKTIQLTIPPDTEPDSYVQLLISKVNGEFSFFGNPSALYIETDEDSNITYSTN